MPLSSTRNEDAACRLTRVPSPRITLLGGSMRNEDATPQKMITKKACKSSQVKYQERQVENISHTIYVDVETAVSFPLRMLMAKAMTDPMKVPSWNMADLV